MMMQNYTFVDPVVDPLMLFAIMIGVVITAVLAMAVYMTRSTTHSAPPSDDAPFVPPSYPADADRTTRRDTRPARPTASRRGRPAHRSEPSSPV